MSSSSLLKALWKDLPIETDFDQFREIYLRELNRPKSPHLKRAVKALQDTASEASDGILTFISSKFALACYSEIPDSFLMWSHYTKGHQGIAIGFDVKNRFFAKGDNLMPVVYRSERMNASFDHGGLKFLEPNIALLRTKSPDWSYEREWRQLFSIRKCRKLRTESGSVQYYQTIPAKAIASATLGVRCSQDTEAVVRELLRAKELRHVRLQRIVLHERDYRLKIVKA